MGARTARKPVAEKIITILDCLPPSVNEEQQQRHLPDVAFFNCPTCGEAADVKMQAFRQEALDKRTWCNNCRKVHLAMLSRCIFGTPWHSCNQHAGEPERLRQVGTVVQTPVKSEPQAANLGRNSTRNSYAVQVNSRRIGQWLDTPPPDRACPTSTISFSAKECEAVGRTAGVLNPRLLSANLKRKFNHLCTD